jgi:hypothetical protein
MTRECSSEGGIALTTACTALRSASPEYVGGVPTAPAVLGHEVGQARLVDRDLAVLEALDLGGVDVDAPDLVAELGKAGRRDETDVAGADDADGFALGAHATATQAIDNTPDDLLRRLDGPSAR